MATKKTTTVKKTAPLKKSETATTKKTKVIKKEISPITIDNEAKSTSTPVAKKQTKSSSVSGLRDAITEAKKRDIETSKPVIKKISDIVIGKDEAAKKDVYTNNEFFEDTATYKKDEIVKKSTFNDNNPKIFSIEDDNAKESATEKAKRLIDEFNEIKKSPLEQIEKKPATPYKMPEPMVESTKKRNHLGILLAAVIVVIAAIGFFVFKGISGKKEDVVVSGNVESSLNVEHVATNVSLGSADATNDILAISNDNTSIPAAVLTPAIETKKYTIQRGNTLAVIAKNELGDDKRWPTIFAMNEKILISPDNFEPFVDIYIPKDKKTVSAMSSDEKKNLYDDYMKVVDYYQKSNKQKEVNFYKNKALEVYKPQ